MQFTIRAIGAPLLAAALLSLAGCSGGTGGGGGSTPEAAFENFKSNMQKKDYAATFNQTTPETQDYMLGNMVLAAGSLALIDPNGGGELQKILDKHGVGKMDPLKMAAGDPLAAAKQMTANVKDKSACYDDIMKALEKNAATKDSVGAPEFASATLTDVKIDGNTANAIIHSKMGTHEINQPAKFKKVGEVWMVDLTIAGPPGAEQPK